MLDWIRENHDTLSLLANIGMLFVWIAYLQLFLANLRRQTQPKILINVGQGRSTDGRCLISNMSSDSIYVESLIATLEADDQQWVCPVTDAQELAEDQEQPESRRMTVQGPLKQAEVMDVGSFRDLIHHVVQDSECPVDTEDAFPKGLAAIQIHAIADFGPDDLLIGAKRRFELVKENGAWVLGDRTPHTEQIRSRRERRRIKRLLEQVDP
ncbi:MAG: hypothetical protein ACOC71_03120 [Hyphomicrobiales bacterium]